MRLLFFVVFVHGPITQEKFLHNMGIGYRLQVTELIPLHTISVLRDNEVAKVMSLQVSICPQEGVCLSACWDTTPPQEQTPPGTRHPPRSRHPHPRTRHPPWEQTPPPGADRPDQAPPLEQNPPPPRDGYCCGRYASYWNAFLLKYFYFCLFFRRYWPKPTVNRESRLSRDTI